MRVTRRSFLGGAVGSLALLFGGFGWKEPEDWYLEKIQWEAKKRRGELTGNIRRVEYWDGYEVYDGKKWVKVPLDDEYVAYRAGMPGFNVRYWSEG